MKHRCAVALMAALVLAILCPAKAVLAQPAATTRPAAAKLSEQINPRVVFKPAKEATDFHFAIVADRTGGERKGVFDRTLDDVNLLVPELTMCVGDLVEGSGANPAAAAVEFDDMQAKVAKLTMPMFYTVGNHDFLTENHRAVWTQRFGKPYYHFVYRSVLFVVMCSMDPDVSIGKVQAQYVVDTLKANKDVRWTFVFLHHPLWLGAGQGGAEGWDAVEAALKGRNYTVFAGHTHNYLYSQRDKMNYFILATSGGASMATGPTTTQFDHFVWVTVTDNGPVIANIMSDGVYGTDPKTTPIMGK